MKVTLAFGKWQESYFRDSFNLKSIRASVISVDISNDPFARNLWYLRDLPKLAGQIAADVVHLSFPAPIRRNAIQCPTVVSLHDLYPYDEPDNFGFPKVFFNRVFLQQCLREIDSVVCVSQTTLARLKVRFPRVAHRKAVVIHNCITIGFEKPVVPVGQRTPFALVIAQHRANKNIRLALRVFEELLNRKAIDQRTLLLLVGNRGPETSAIASFIQHQALERHVKLIDRVTDGELKWLYENCQVLLVPSSIEGFGLPLAEALFCGSRVVCSDIPAFREIGGDACNYFDLHAKSDSSAMFEAVCNALSGPARPATRLERFFPETIAGEYASLYSHLREESVS